MATIYGFFHLRQKAEGDRKETSTFLRRKRCKASGTNAAYFNSSHKIPWPSLGRESQTVLGKTDRQQGESQRWGAGVGVVLQANVARVQAPTATWWSALERQVDGAGWSPVLAQATGQRDCSSELALAHSILSLTHSSIHLSTHFFIHSTKV